MNQEKPQIGRPKNDQPVPSALRKRKRAKQQNRKKKKAKKNKATPKNQPSISSFFAKVKK